MTMFDFETIAQRINSPLFVWLWCLLTIAFAIRWLVSLQATSTAIRHALKIATKAVRTGKTPQQWQIFKKITGKTNGEYRFAQITKEFGDKFLSFFFDGTMHKVSLCFWLKQLGETAVKRVDEMLNNERWGNSVN